LKMGGNEDAFQQLKAVLNRAKDQILSDIPESDHVDVMCVVVELIEGHTEEEVKYTLGKMCLVLTQISAGLKVIQGASDRAHNLFRCGDVTHSTDRYVSEFRSTDMITHILLS
jgi:hypothetical protein